MTPATTPLDQWLSDATRGLSAESAAQVRAEIQQHYDLAHEDSACEAGGDALAALGDPRTANRAYRKVLLTEQEAMMAPVLTRPARSRRLDILFSFALLAVVFWRLSGKHHEPGFWPITIAILCTLPFPSLFPLNTLERTRPYLYVQGLRDIAVVGIVWWYHGWIGALAIGAICLSFDYFSWYRRLLLLRKLAAGQTYSPLPGEPQLTHLDAMYLHGLEKGGMYEKTSLAVIFLILAGATVWLPATFAPLAIWMTAGFVALRTLPIYTEERSRWFRIAKWTTMAVAAVLPVLYGARIPWIGTVYLAVIFLLTDMRSIPLRRKLPVAKWPKRLYG